MKRSTIALFLVALFAHACVNPEEFNFDRLASTSYSPNVGFPVAKSVFHVEDIMAKTDSSVLSVGQDGLVTLNYTSSELELSADELFQMPSSAVVPNTQIPVAPGLDTVVEIPFPASFGIEVSEIDFSTCNLFVELISGDNRTATFTFNSIELNGSPVVANVNLAGPATTQNIDGATLKLTPAGNVEIRITIPSGFVPSNPFPVLRMRLTEMDYQTIRGDFKTLDVELPQDSIKLHIFKNLVRDGVLHLEDPSVQLDVENGFGMPIEIDLSSMQGFNPVTSQITPMFNSTAGKFQIKRGTSTSPSDNLLEISRSNSNILDVIRPTPIYMVHKSRVVTNPQGGVPSPLNELDKEAKLKVATKMKLPLQGRIRGLVISDTAGSTFNQSFDLVSQVNIKTAVRNGFPFDVVLTLTLLDSVYNPVITPSGNVVKLIDAESVFVAGAANSDGRVDQSNLTLVSSTYNLSEEETQCLLKGRYILIEGEIQTYNGGNTNISIYDDYTMEVKLGVGVVGNVKF